MIDLNGSLLMISARSPFARRVRIALLEAGVRFEVQVVDVFRPTRELMQANPLGRVPALRTPEGEWIVDSHLILDTLYWHSTAAPPRPPDGQVARLARLSGLAVGVCEKTVERYIESLRPPEQQDAEVLAEFTAARDGALQALEDLLAGGFRFPQGAGMCQAEIDWGCAVGYLDLRDSPAWRDKTPHVARWAEGVLGRGVFQQTGPQARAF